jgi:hypothetical protein
MNLSVLLLLVVLLSFVHIDGAFAGDATESGMAPPAAGENWLTWHTDHYFGRCDGNCALSIFGGPQVKTHLADILFEDPSPPWDWRWGDSQLIGAAFSRRLLTLWHALDVEPEVGLAKRFDDMHADEAWAAIYFRWTRFPWNHSLRTTIAVSVGPSFAVDLPKGSHGSFVLNYFSPELTFALPKFSQYALLIQIHHRSNLWIAKNGDSGWQYLTVGMRFRF